MPDYTSNIMKQQQQYLTSHLQKTNAEHIFVEKMFQIIHIGQEMNELRKWWIQKDEEQIK